MRDSTCLVVGDVYGVIINTVPLTTFDLAGVGEGDVNLRLKNVLEDFIHILAIKTRNMDLTSADFNNVIPAGIRLKINVFLTAKGWPTVPAGYTWRQLFDAIKARL